MTNTECQKRKSDYYGESTIWCKCGNRDPVALNRRYKIWARYCCSTMPCERKGDEIHCKNGTVKSITEECGINECPTSQVVSSSALSINEGEFTMYIIEK